MSETEITAGTYRHFKGGRYEVIGVARHSETEEPHVVYRPIGADGVPGALWVRPASMWTEHVERDGYAGPRFARAD